ncbi:hypothetical protein [Novosphingobium sp. Chol11]|jgi:hypothetical protein|uniref:hypothetical protein n=1 Tax=Novosphingobium sp. Chol11 TaxID=1385763 RepID=UPI000BE26CF2|nr:hypothetical protein [Novosphingobium sp. Chol11]
MMGYTIVNKGRQSVKEAVNARSRDRRRQLADETKLRSAVSVMGRDDLLPELELKYRAPATLKAAKRRLRKSECGHVENLCRSISVMGFCVPILISADGIIIEDEADAETDLPIVTVPGDLWQFGKHRLFCGDALLHECYAGQLGDERARMVLTDPTI